MSTREASGSMAKTTTTNLKADRPTQIIGFRLSQELAREVKAEAGRRGMRLARLFEELWDDYRRRRPKS
jgi:hypothetical protein